MVENTKKEDRNMAIIKCKMCGGDLNMTEGLTTAECEFCGSIQTVPTVQDENLQALFNRANLLRRKSEFDKAEQIYEKIIQSDNTQAEAYWGLILCKFGIEYVEDPATFKRVPTCHRTLLDSIIADEDYKSALEHADLLQRRIYENEAREIDRLQKEIIALSQKEEPYDVFICYKESDDSGKRTPDSVIANEIYHQLTQEGLKVFYAAITLEDKLGAAYEPCIFAALSSAKVMLAIGTKPEYFNAIWVKNEWSRFLKMMKQDRAKLLIPCYKDMDAYELPEEFAHLQAQDMGKIGFINDVVRGINKVLQKDEPQETVKETVVVSSSNANAAPLLKRAKMFLEDSDWSSADEYAEKVLDLDPECAQAYIVKLCAMLRLSGEEKLGTLHEPPEKYATFQKAMRFADAGYRNVLEGYIASARNLIEIDRKTGIYQNAKNLYSTQDPEKILQAKPLFEQIPGWKDADELAASCEEKAETVRKDNIYVKAAGLAKDNYSMDSQRAAAKLYAAIAGWKDADERKETCENRIEELKEQEEIKRKNKIYDDGCKELRKRDIFSVKRSIDRFRQIPGWKDADEKAVEAEELLKKLEEKAEAERQERIEKERIRKEREAQINGYKAKYPAIRRLEQLNIEIPKKEKQLAEHVEIMEKETGSLGFWIWGLGQGGLGLACIDFAEEIAIINILFGVIALIIACCMNGKRKARADVRDIRWELNELRREQKQLEKEVPSFEEYLASLNEE